MEGEEDERKEGEGKDTKEILLGRRGEGDGKERGKGGGGREGIHNYSLYCFSIYTLLYMYSSSSPLFLYFKRIKIHVMLATIYILY